MGQIFSEADQTNLVQVTGLILSSSPIGEYDKRVVILTRERGKLSAFAKGSRRQNSPLISGTRPFCFGTFLLYEGRNSFTVKQLSITNYFEDVTSHMEYVYLGYYFLEFADYYSRENGDEFVTLKLLYQALRALSKESLDNRLVRLVFELRMMAMNGDFSGRYFERLSEAGRYTTDFIINTPVEKLFTFAVSGAVLSELAKAVEENKMRYIERQFKSEQVLNSMNITFS